MTPPSVRSRDTRQRLLEVAGEVFAGRGFRDATIQEICRRADANIAAVHYHFGDKEELYRTVIQYAEQCAPENPPADRAPDAPAEKRLRAHIESFPENALRRAYLPNYKIGKAKAVDAVIEPRVGGRWYERGDDGSTCDWGSVLSWEPHSGLVLSWDITADWQYDPNLKTGIEVRFIADGKNHTRIELEHRRLDRYGARRDEMRRIFDTEGDWGRLLEMFARAAAA